MATFSLWGCPYSNFPPSLGRFAWQGRYLPESDLPQEAQDLLNRYRQVQYYYENRAKPD